MAQSNRRGAAIVKIKASYLAGEGSLEELAEKYKVPKTTIFKYSMKENWKAVRDETYKRAVHKATEVLSSKQATFIVQRAEEVEKMKEKTRVGANSIYTAIMTKLVVPDPERPGKQKLNPDLTSTEINQLSSALKKAIELLFISYGEAFQIVKHSGNIGLEKKTLLDYLQGGDVDHALEQYGKDPGRP